MEQAYRRLLKTLEENPLVDRAKYTHCYINIWWKSGIKERLIVHRYENNDFLLNRYRKSPVWRPVFLPQAMWWEDLSQNSVPILNYSDNVSELNDDVSKYSNLANWKWSDYEQCGAWERILLVHTVLQYVMDHGWKNQIFPEDTLNNSLQMVFNEKLNLYEAKDGYKLRSFNGKERPGDKLIQHFMPCGHYGKNDPYYYLSTGSLPQKRRIYLAIRNIINRNKILKKKGRKQFLDFNYDSIMKCMRKKRTSYKIIPYRLKQIGLYRTLIKRFDLNNQSFYDIDPLLGEKYLSCMVEQCPYYYRETAPFDDKCQKLAEFTSYDCTADTDGHYDFAIFDNGFVFDEDILEESWKIFENKVDMLIIFVQNPHMDIWLERHPDPIESISMKPSNRPDNIGKWLIYYF